MPKVLGTKLPEWTHSRAAWGSILLALGGVATAVGKLLSGELDLNAFITQAGPFFGSALAVWGIRFKKG